MLPVEQRDPSGTAVDTQVDGSRGILRIVGDLDAAAVPAVREAIAALGDVSEIEVDLSRVTFMDSSGLGVLISAARRARQCSQGFRLSKERPAMVDRLLRLTGVSEAFDVQRPS